MVPAAPGPVAVVGDRPARRPGLHSAPSHSPRPGRCRHQAVPLPRPRPPAGERPVDVGPERRDGHRHAPEHRLPVAAGALVLAVRSPGFPGLGGAATVVGHPAVPGRSRRGVPAADAGLAQQRLCRRCPVRAGGLTGRAGLHALAVRHRVHRAHLGHPAAVGRAALAGRHRGAGPAVRPERPARRNRALAPPGAVRPGRHLYRCDQCHVADLCPDCAHPLGPVRCLVEPGGQAAPGPAVRRADDPAHLRGFAVVDGGAVHTGGLRAQRPAVQRDGQDGRWGVPGVRGATRSGQLVRLRRGRRRTLGPGDEGLHGKRASAGADFRAAAARHARRGLGPLDSPGLLRHAHLRRHGDQRRRLPL